MTLQSGYADYWRDHMATVEEQDLLRMRWFYVDAVKRVMKRDALNEADLRNVAEKLSNREDRIQELLSLVRGPNPQPWP